MDRVSELERKLEEANARIRHLEKLKVDRPITIRQMKAEIGEVIGADLSGGNYTYMATVSRADLLKIHAWILGQKDKGGCRSCGACESDRHAPVNLPGVCGQYTR